MINYNEEGIAVLGLPDYKLNFFSRKFKKDGFMRVPSPVGVMSPCPSACILSSGRIQVINNRTPDEVQIISHSPGQIFKGDMMPGIFDVTALDDDTVYTCLIQNDPSLSALDNALKTDWEFSVRLGTFPLEEDRLIALYGNRHTRIMVCLHGTVLVGVPGEEERTVIEAGEALAIPEGHLIEIHRDYSTDTYAEIAWPETNP